MDSDWPAAILCFIGSCLFWVGLWALFVSGPVAILCFMGACLLWALTWP